MDHQDAPGEWVAVQGSVRGASHERAAKPNQDRCAVRSLPGGQVAAVADGHGSRRSFRSDRGAKLAVETAVELLARIAPAESSGPGALSELLRCAEAELCQQIVRHWQGQVDADIATEPLSESELAPLSDVERESVLRDPRVAYGSTLLATLILPACALYLQLGDGDLLVADAGGEVYRPLPGDGRSFANETASLAPPAPPTVGKRPAGAGGVWADFRLRVVPVTADSPALVLLTTDGYSNAFVDDAAFRKVATDILAIGRAEGWDHVARELPVWLGEASRHGSGDDATAVVLSRRAGGSGHEARAPNVTPAGSESNPTASGYAGTGSTPRTEPPYPESA